MAEIIPDVINELYGYFVPSPVPKFWPEYLEHDPMQAHGLWSFYQGLQLGLQLGWLCRD